MIKELPKQPGEPRYYRMIPPTKGVYQKVCLLVFNGTEWVAARNTYSFMWDIFDPLTGEDRGRVRDDLFHKLCFPFKLFYLVEVPKPAGEPVDVYAKYLCPDHHSHS